MLNCLFCKLASVEKGNLIWLACAYFAPSHSLPLFCPAVAVTVQILSALLVSSFTPFVSRTRSCSSLNTICFAFSLIFSSHILIAKEGERTTNGQKGEQFMKEKSGSGDILVFVSDWEGIYSYFPFPLYIIFLLLNERDDDT